MQVSVEKHKFPCLCSFAPTHVSKNFGKPTGKAPCLTHVFVFFGFKAFLVLKELVMHFPEFSLFISTFAGFRGFLRVTMGIAERKMNVCEVNASGILGKNLLYNWVSITARGALEIGKLHNAHFCIRIAF